MAGSRGHGFGATVLRVVKVAFGVALLGAVLLMGLIVAMGLLLWALIRGRRPQKVWPRQFQQPWANRGGHSAGAKSSARGSGDVVDVEVREITASR